MENSDAWGGWRIWKKEDETLNFLRNNLSLGFCADEKANEHKEVAIKGLILKKN